MDNNRGAASEHKEKSITKHQQKKIYISITLSRYRVEEKFRHSVCRKIYVRKNNNELAHLGKTRNTTNMFAQDKAQSLLEYDQTQVVVTRTYTVNTSATEALNIKSQRSTLKRKVGMAGDNGQKEAEMDGLFCLRSCTRYFLRVCQLRLKLYF